MIDLEHASCSDSWSLGVLRKSNGQQIVRLGTVLVIRANFGCGKSKQGFYKLVTVPEFVAPIVIDDSSD